MHATHCTHHQRTKCPRLVWCEYICVWYRARVLATTCHHSTCFGQHKVVDAKCRSDQITHIAHAHITPFTNPFASLFVCQKFYFSDSMLYFAQYTTSRSSFELLTSEMNKKPPVRFVIGLPRSTQLSYIFKQRAFTLCREHTLHSAEL